MMGKDRTDLYAAGITKRNVFTNLKYSKKNKVSNSYLIDMQADTSIIEDYTPVSFSFANGCSIIEQIRSDVLKP